MQHLSEPFISIYADFGDGRTEKHTFGREAPPKRWFVEFQSSTRMFDSRLKIGSANSQHFETQHIPTRCPSDYKDVESPDHWEVMGSVSPCDLLSRWRVTTSQVLGATATLAYLCPWCPRGSCPQRDPRRLPQSLPRYLSCWKCDVRISYQEQTEEWWYPLLFG